MALTHTHTQPIPRHNRVLPDRVLVKGTRGGGGVGILAKLLWHEENQRNGEWRLRCHKICLHESAVKRVVMRRGEVIFFCLQHAMFWHLVRRRNRVFFSFDISFIKCWIFFVSEFSHQSVLKILQHPPKLTNWIVHSLNTCIRTL